MKKFFLILLALAFVLPVQAADFAVPIDRNDPNLTIGANETRTNLYVAGGNVNVNGTVLGDLVAAGGMITLDGRVEKDLIAAGGNLFLNGEVGDDVKVAGGNLNINAPIRGDLLIAGGNVTISERASIGGDLVLAGGNVIVNGPVTGKLRATGGSLNINSRIGGDAVIKVSQNLTFGSRAEMAGQTNYQAPEQARVLDGARLGEINYTPYQPSKDYRKSVAGIFSAGILVRLVAWFLTLLLLWSLFRSPFGATYEELKRKPLGSLGAGFLTFILVPVLFVVLLVTIVGYYAAFILAAAYALVLMLANLASAAMVGMYIGSKLWKNKSNLPIWQMAAIGVVVWQLVKLIPILGGIASFILFILVLGAFVKILKSHWQANRDVQIRQDTVV